MTVENINPEIQTIENEPMIKKSDHQQLMEDIRKAYSDDMSELANVVLKQIPDGLKALIPEQLSPADKVRWYEKAKAAGLLIKPVIPETDTTKPALSTPKIDPSELPPIARLSYGYNNSKH